MNKIKPTQLRGFLFGGPKRPYFELFLKICTILLKDHKTFFLFNQSAQYSILNLILDKKLKN
ncbi:MAG: hypothetical protein CL832_00120 [Crocinitomicaceae bacterium]|nr:hypothetical protein [Crocinitomicaceae bacterium]